jgi:hypothetical protein
MILVVFLVVELPESQQSQETVFRENLESLFGNRLQETLKQTEKTSKVVFGFFF